MLGLERSRVNETRVMPMSVQGGSRCRAGEGCGSLVGIAASLCVLGSIKRWCCGAAGCCGAKVTAGLRSGAVVQETLSLVRALEGGVAALLLGMMDHFI